MKKKLTYTDVLTTARSGTVVSVLREIATTNTDDRVLTALCHNPAMPGELLNIVVFRSSNPRVKELVAVHPNAPALLLRKLSKVNDRLARLVALTRVLPLTCLHSCPGTQTRRFGLGLLGTGTLLVMFW